MRDHRRGEQTAASWRATRTTDTGIAPVPDLAAVRDEVEPKSIGPALASVLASTDTAGNGVASHAEHGPALEVRHDAAMAGVRAVILAGGLGTRLRPYTTVIPKPLVPIADRPVLEHIIRCLTATGITQIDLCVSHLGQLICLYLREASLPPEVRVDFHWETEPLGTAGALRSVPDLGGTFVVMNGDILTTLDYRDLVEYHREQDVALTVAMKSKHVDIDLGVMDVEDGLILDYREKPALSFDVSMGIYVYEARALRYLPDGPCQFPELVLRLIAAGERVAAYRSDADWYDIGTLPEYERAAADVERFPARFGLE
jgi:NDP-mannose synthase